MSSDSASAFAASVLPTPASPSSSSGWGSRSGEEERGRQSRRRRGSRPRPAGGRATRRPGRRPALPRARRGGPTASCLREHPRVVVPGVGDQLHTAQVYLLAVAAASLPSTQSGCSNGAEAPRRARTEQPPRWLPAGSRSAARSRRPRRGSDARPRGRGALGRRCELAPAALVSDGQRREEGTPWL